MALVSAGMIVLSKYIFRSNEKCKQDSILFVQLALAVSILLNLLGYVYLYQLYKKGFQYDKLLHFINPSYFVIALAYFLEVWQKLSIKKAALRAALIVIVGSVLWEVFEFLSDYFFHTTAFGINGQYVYFDTSFDLLFDYLGVYAGFRLISSREVYNIVASEYCQNETRSEAVKAKEKI
jgi:hypothetical protein